MGERLELRNLQSETQPLRTHDPHGTYVDGQSARFFNKRDDGTNLSVAADSTPVDGSWSAITATDETQERDGNAHLLHSAQESSPRERFTWTSSGGMDFRTEEPLASELDRMAVAGAEGGGGMVGRDGGGDCRGWDGAPYGRLYMML